MLDDKINSLNPQQREAVLTTQGPLLLLAGAGSGKTRVLTHRIAHLIEQGVRPFNILAITFTNKAAKEMKERVMQISERGGDVWVSTFHSTCVRILRREIDRLGYSTNFSIYDSDDSLRLIKSIMKELNLSDKHFPPKAIAAEIGRQKDKLITPEEYADNVGTKFPFSTYAKIYQRYQEQLKANFALDFDDLIFKTVELFRQCPEVLEKYQERFRYIMVDEYQDTNASQYQLVKLLASKYHNLCVVGDDDQSIYGWRGADISNILDFEKDFENTKVIKLEQNYRSTQVILDSANAVIHNNVQRKDKSLWTEEKNGEKIKFFNAGSDNKEAEFVCDEIEKGAAAGKKYQDFAILYRNNALSRAAEEKLVRRGIPYRLYGGTKFYDRKEIKDILGYLKLIANPNDDMAFRRIVNEPKRGIGTTTVDKIAEIALLNGQSMYMTACDGSALAQVAAAARKKIDAFTAMINSFRADLNEEAALTDIFEDILDKSGYSEMLKKEGTDEAKGRLDNIAELFNKVKEYCDNNGALATLAGFLEEVSLVSDVDNYDEDNDAVVLMTMHSSKGLEFDTVFIMGFEEGIFPSTMAIEEDPFSGLEEERRLCYVGITRAKRQLYLTCAKSRMQYGYPVSNRPSRFLKEIPEENIEKLSIASTYSEYNDKGVNDIFGMAAPKPAAKSILGFGKSKPKAEINYEVGDKVRHIKFGIGTVLDMTPAGADYEVKVEFDTVGIKRLMAEFSRLKKI